MKLMCKLCLTIAAIIGLWIVYMLWNCADAAPAYPLPPRRPVELREPIIMTMPPLVLAPEPPKKERSWLPWIGEQQ